MDISILKKIGFNDKEIKVYLALLEYSNLSVRALAELTGVNRGTVYDILKSMQERGLASYYHVGSKQRFVAEDPEKLLILLDNREDEFKRLKYGLQDLVPELKSLMDKGGDLLVTKFYEGPGGIRQILGDVLASVPAGEEYFVYSSKNSSEDINRIFPDFTRQRVKKGIKVRVISLAQGGKLSGLDQRRWLGTDKQSATFVILYAGKCAYIDRDPKGLPIGVVIENKSIFMTNSLVFDKLWQLLASNSAPGKDTAVRL